MSNATQIFKSGFKRALMLASATAVLGLAASAGAQVLASQLTDLEPQAVQQAPSADARSLLPPGAPIIQLSGQQLNLILKTLDEAESHGFERGEFGPADLTQQFASRDRNVRNQAAAQVGPAIVRYAQAQHGQRLAVSRFLDDWGMRPEPYDAPGAFAQAVAANKVAEWLASLPPPYEGYRQMRVALGVYRGLAAKGGWSGVPDGPSLRPGMSDPRVPALRQRLTWEDSQVPAATPGAETRFDPGLADALSRFQASHGLRPDGVMGKDAVAELNTPVETRVGAIEANLERWRWAPRTSPVTRIEVNIASQQVDYYEAGKLAEAMKAVAGKKTTPTPMLVSQVHSLVLNPPWNVPTSIATKELWPKERSSPGYLSRSNFVVREGGGLQQQPGPDNSLGRVKFDFANKYGVYLHDTPGRAAFARDMRNLSHGCVRLERPIDLAKRLLANGGQLGPDDVDTVLLGDETTRAKLAKPVPVYLFYWTVFVDNTAKLNFRPDVYNWDATLLGRLDAGRSRS